MSDENFNKIALQKKNWISHPKKINVVLVLSVWIISSTLLVLAMTDLFSESFFNSDYIIIYLMMIMSTLTCFRVIVNYLRRK